MVKVVGVVPRFVVRCDRLSHIRQSVVACPLSVTSVLCRRSLDRDSVKHLRTLLSMKTKAGYSHTPGHYSRVQARRPSRRGAARDSPPHARHGSNLSGTRRSWQPSRLAAKLAASWTETDGSQRTPLEAIMLLTCRYATSVDVRGPPLIALKSVAQARRQHGVVAGASNDQNLWMGLGEVT